MARRFLGLVVVSLLVLGCGSEGTTALTAAPSTGPTTPSPTVSPTPGGTDSQGALTGLLGEPQQDIVSELEEMGYEVRERVGDEVALGLVFDPDVLRALTIIRVTGDPITKIQCTIGDVSDLLSVGDWTVLLATHGRTDATFWLADALGGIKQMKDKSTIEATMDDGALASLYFRTGNGNFAFQMTLSVDGRGTDR